MIFLAFSIIGTIGNPVQLFFGKDENLKKYWMVNSMRDLHALVLESHP